MTHIELSLSPLPQGPGDTGGADPLEQWAAPVETAEELCLVIDAGGIVFAASRPFARRLAPGLDLVGQHIYDVLFLIDFTAAGNELGDGEREQIPPVLALNGLPARGLIRVRLGSASETLDALATPLRRHGKVVGSLSFFAV